MSRTDIHRPPHAMAQDPSMREHFKEFHHHTEKDDQGRLICDIEIAWEVFRSGGWVRTNCYPQWWSELRTCGCPQCTGQSGRRRTRRRDRHETRRSCHELIAQQAAGDLDEDGPHARRIEPLWY